MWATQIGRDKRQDSIRERLGAEVRGPVTRPGRRVTLDKPLEPKPLACAADAVKLGGLIRPARLDEDGPGELALQRR
jgi:hypothetical protein